MSTLQKQLEEFQREHGHVHEEERTETYRCKPYKESSLKYSKPRPDPEGEATYTHTVKENKLDSLTEAEKSLAVQLTQVIETKGTTNAIKELQDDFRSETEQMKNSVNVIKNILIGYAVLTAINLIIAIYVISKIGSLF